MVPAQATSITTLLVRVKRLLLGAVAAVLLAIGTPVGASDLIRERAWFEDVGGQRSLAEVQSQPFAPFTGLLSRGFGASPIWVRLQVEASDASADGARSAEELLVLRIAPAHLDEIELFDPLAPAATPRITGDRYAWRAGEHPTLAHSFLVPRGSASRPVWLRIQTASSRVLAVELLTQAQSRRAELKTDMVSSAYLGLLVLFFVWALYLYWVLPETIVAAFAIKQLAAVVYSLFFLGHMRVFLDGVVPPRSIDALFILAFIGYVMTALSYQYWLFKAMNVPLWKLRVLKLASLTLCLALLLPFAGQAMLAMMWTVAVVLFLLVFGVITALLCRYAMPWQDSFTVQISRRALVLSHVLLSAVVLGTMLPVLGLATAPASAVYYPLAYALLSGCVFLWLLQMRTHGMISRQAGMQAALQVVVQKMETEQAFRKDQQHLLAMLTHEIKTPLAAIAMLIANTKPAPDAIGQVQMALGEVNSIIDRCIQTGRMEDGSKTFSKTTFDIDAMLQQMTQSRPHTTRIRYEGPGASLLHSDEQVVRMLLNNLLENASRYGAAGKAVRVHLRPCTERGTAGVQILVENQPGSAGWPDPARVFEKYYRSPHAHRQSGSGLGLYLAAGFAQRLDGSIRYAPTLTTIGFELWLPL